MKGRSIISIDVRYEEDVVLVRQRARQIAAALGLPLTDQVSVATAVSEIVRNALRYAGSARTEFALELDARPQVLNVRVTDNGPGIADVDGVLNGTYVSQTGQGMGLAGSRRLSDTFDLQTEIGRGTTVTLGKFLPRTTQPVRPDIIAAIGAELTRRTPRGPVDELQQQNKELLQAMDALKSRQAEVERLNAELAETNRGVVALYAELDDRAESLRKASEYKSRFLSDMTHELRTPLNAVVSLSRLLLDRVDGDLTAEQETQVSLINNSAMSLGEMVNDLLDLARIEAGKVDVQAQPFSVSSTLAAVRGIFRPLQLDDRVQLVIDEPVDLPTLHSDERKLTQILRNLVSNALKFTEKGIVRVTAEAGPDDTAIFTVADTGIGIGPQDLDRIFDDFTQIDSGVQRRVVGTGLGLPLTRKLSRLLGGDVTVHSTLGVGSTFVVTLPVTVVVPAEKGSELEATEGSLS